MGRHYRSSQSMLAYRTTRCELESNTAAAGARPLWGYGCLLSCFSVHSFAKADAYWVRPKSQTLNISPPRTPCPHPIINMACLFHFTLIDTVPYFGATPISCFQGSSILWPVRDSFIMPYFIFSIPHLHDAFLKILSYNSWDCLYLFTPLITATQA